MRRTLSMALAILALAGFARGFADLHHDRPCARPPVQHAHQHQHHDHGHAHAPVTVQHDCP